jgi:uncharacterized protein (DUF736 family)
MATIGTLTKREDGRYEGELHTLSLRAAITILPIEKLTPNQPDFRVMSEGIEIGAGWLRKGQTSGYLQDDASRIGRSGHRVRRHALCRV